MTPEFERECARAVQVVFPEGKKLRAGRAILFIFGVLGWRKTTRFLALPPMIWAVELGYAIVAGQRRLFGRFLFRDE
jgi:hypothetical protein